MTALLAARRLRRVLALAGVAVLLNVPVGAAGTSGGPTPRPEAPAGAPLTVVSLTFDDGYATQVPAAELLAEHGLPATFYLNSALLGRTPYADPSWVADLVAMGHEVGGHTRRHGDLLTMSPFDRAVAICRDRQALQISGAQVTSFAYPYGSFDDAVVEQVQSCGYDSARAASGLQVGSDCISCPAAESLDPIDHRYDIRTPGTVRAEDSWQDLAALVERAEVDGGWVPLVLHRVCEGCAEESTSLSTLDAFASWLRTRPATTVVLTVGEVTSGEGSAPGAAVLEALDRAAAEAEAADGAADGGAEGGSDRDSDQGLLPPPRAESSIRVLGVPVDQLFLIGGGLLLATVALTVHRLATRGRRYR